MLSLKTHSNFGSVLNLNFFHVKFSVRFVQLLAVVSSVNLRNVILPVYFDVKINPELIRSEISKSFDN